jgi:molybdopterin-guanine dinucleotide biosynthesis protein A
MNRLAAVILAGGRGERLGGVEKARLKVGGIRLIDRVAASLSRQAATILYSCGPELADSSALPDDLIVIPDLDSAFGGPLAGIAAAVDWLQQRPEGPEFLLTVAVDTPFFPADFAAKALPALADGCAAAIGCFEGQDYPTNGIWRLSSLATLPQHVRDGSAPKGPKILLREMTTTRLEWFPQDGGDPFANVNTLQDLVNLNKRARQAHLSA